MSKFNFQQISDTNNCERLLFQLCLLKAHKIKNNYIHTQELTDRLHEYVIASEPFCSESFSKLQDNTTEIVFHKLWNKLTKFHKTDRIKHYIKSLPNISEKNAETLIKLILKKVFVDKFFVATNSSFKESTSKKNKYTIDYDPIKGCISDIEGIKYNGKKYETEF